MAQNNEEEGWHGFLNLCLEAESTEKLNELFWLFLTPEERKDIASRVLIVRDLVRGQKTQREMAKDLRVSVAKITRGSNFLKMISKDLKNFLEPLCR